MMFVDTNVLVYAAAPGAPLHPSARAALVRYGGAETLCLSRQVLREFVAVLTRPQVWAQARTPAAAADAALVLEQRFDVLEDGPLVWERLVELCRGFAFGGRQVHDANIVATMRAHGETRLLTFNTGDYRRFVGLIGLAAPPGA